MNTSDLSGQTAVITGGARGLGQTFAHVLAKAKCNIAILDILPSPFEEFHEFESKYDVKGQYYKCDITSQAAVLEVVARIEDDFGRIDINVNAAGVVSDEPFLTTSAENIARTFAVNVYGSFFVAQACAQSMTQRIKATRTPPIDPTEDGGSIVFITSISTHISSVVQNISAYVASKAAVRGLVKPLAMELAPYGIRCNSLSPGYMMTDMMRGLQKQQPDLVRQFQKETLLSGGERIGRPADLGGPLLMLCSRNAGGWITGQELLVDGGAGGWKHNAIL